MTSDVQDEVYFSIDIETDGQVPGLNSMRSLGLFAFTAEHIPIGEFKVNLAPFPGANPDPETMKWWAETEEKRAMWRDINTHNVRDPSEAMYEALGFIHVQKEKTGFRPVCVASPVGFDFSFFRWYAFATTGRDSPFGHRCLDVRTYVMALYGRRYMESSNRDLPPEIRTELPITHDSLADARTQGHIFFNLLQEQKRRRGGGSCPQLSESLSG
jgi:hypothetical protein